MKIVDSPNSIPAESLEYVFTNDKSNPRAYEITNGVIFTIRVKEKEYTLQFEDNLLYEVEYKLCNGFMVECTRTGVVLTLEELNDLIK